MKRWKGTIEAMEQNEQEIRLRVKVPSLGRTILLHMEDNAELDLYVGKEIEIEHCGCSTCEMYYGTVPS